MPRMDPKMAILISDQKRPRFEISNLYLFQYCMKLNQPNKFWDNLKPEFCPSVTSISLKFFSTSAALHNHTAWALALSGGTYGTSAMTWSWKNITAHIPLGSCSGGTSSPRKTIKTMGKPCENLGKFTGEMRKHWAPKKPSETSIQMIFQIWRRSQL